jgi:hypothetical protein
MLALIAAVLMQAGPAAPPPAEPRPADDTVRPAPLTPNQAVDANGVPRWAKGKPKQFVQNCPAFRPNIGNETWRAQYIANEGGTPRANIRVPRVTCK